MGATVRGSLLVILAYIASYFGVLAQRTTHAENLRVVHSEIKSMERWNRQDESKAPQGPINCEDFQAYLDDAILRWQELKGTYLIVLVRLGTGEREPELNGLRLKYIEDYLKRHRVEYIGAQGERVKGLGRMEFFVGGKLISSILIKPHAKRVCSGSTGG